MVSNVTNKTGVIFAVVLAVMMLGLFTSVDSLVAADKSGPQKVSASDAKNIEIAAKFDGQKWLELYRSNGWDKTKFSRLTQKAQTYGLKDMSEKLSALHQTMAGQAKGNNLSLYRSKILESFRLSREVTSISQRGSLLKSAQFAAAGTTTLLLNGMDPDTITVGDSLVITVDLLGDTAFFEVFWDANNNQIVDAGDFSLFDDDDDAFVVDDGFEDENLTPGIIQITLYPFEDDDDDFLIVSESNWLITADDGAAADTAALRVEADPSSFTVSGSVGAHEGVLILAFEVVPEETFEDGPEIFTLTISDASGNYTLDLPTESAGIWFIGAFDFFDVTGGLFPDTAYVQVVTGDETGIDFNFITGDATITVSVQDNNGFALEGVPVSAFQDDGFGVEVFGTTNALGNVDLAVVGGDWNVSPDPDWFNPNYLVPFTQYVNVPQGGFALVNLVAYVTDSFITGTTFLNSEATGGFEVRGTSQLGYTLTTSDAAGGTYSLPTSSYADLEMGNNGYCVAVCHLSEDQFSPQDQFEIASDSAGVSLYVYTAQGAIEGHVYSQETGAPIPFAGVDVYGNSGFMNFGGTDESGYYFIPVLNDTFIVNVWAEGFMFEYEDSVVVLNDTVYVEFNLQPFDGGEPGVIRGMVFSNFTGDPIVGANVQVFSDFFFEETGTDESGFYNFDVPGGVYGVGASAVGFFSDFTDNLVVNGDTVWQDLFLDSSGGVFYPDIFWVRDVPNDQGRKVTVTWQMADIGNGRITNYSLWRWEDALGMGGAPTFIESIPNVDYFYEYAYDAPTLGDSISPTNIWESTFQVFAHGEDRGDGMILLDGFPGTGWSVDNLIPEAPALVGTATAEGIELSWTEIVEEEAKFYTVYRSIGDGTVFTPIENTIETVYLDSDASVVGSYSYFVTATDFSENEGKKSNDFSFVVTGIDGFSGAIPKVFALDQNYPNPFNPTTRINYQLPVSGNVVVEVYNLRGEIVTTLVDGNMQAGFHSVEWNGLTSSGNQISSGVYLYRIQAGDFNKVRKMIMLK